jgi:hypothetical protein
MTLCFKHQCVQHYVATHYVQHYGEAHTVIPGCNYPRLVGLQMASQGGGEAYDSPLSYLSFMKGFSRFYQSVGSIRGRPAAAQLGSKWGWLSCMHACMHAKLVPY